MIDKTIKISKSMNLDDLSLIIEAIDLYVRGGHRASVHFYDSKTDEEIPFFDHPPASIMEMLNSGRAYIAPATSSNPDHRFSNDEKLRLERVRGYLQRKMNELDKDVEESINKIARDELDDVVTGFYDLLRDDGGGKQS